MREDLDHSGLIYYSSKLKSYLSSKFKSVDSSINDLSTKVDTTTNDLTAKTNDLTAKIQTNTDNITENSKGIVTVDGKVIKLKDQLDNTNLECKGHPEGDTININNVEQYIFKDIEPNETVKIPNTGDGVDFLAECFVETDKGDEIKHKVLDFNTKTKDFIDYNPMYIVVDDEGIKPRTEIRMKLTKQKVNDNLTMYTTEKIPAELLDSIENLKSLEPFLWE